MGSVNPDEKIRTTVDIFGTTYRLIGTQSQAYMEKIAAYVNENMEAIAKGNPRLDTKRVSVLALISMADEYFQLRSKWDAIQEERSQAQLRVEELRKTLELTEEKERSKTQELMQLQEQLEQLQEENARLAKEAELASLSWAERVAEWEAKYEAAVKEAAEEKAQLLARISMLEAEQARLEAAASAQQEAKEEASAAPAAGKNAAEEISESDLTLLEKYNKLHEEYIKLQNEFNEWIELTQSETQ
jgi:cell division protein ZapA